MIYFEFKYVEINGTEIVSQGDALYYTSGEKNINEMKNLSRQFLQNPAAVVSITLVTEIDRASFLVKGGNPNV